MRWQPIETAPRDGTRIMARGPAGNVIRPQVRRQTWWGKTSHVPLYGWCWMRHAQDFENVDLWNPTHWRPADSASDAT